MAFFQSLKKNFIAYRSSKVYSCPDCIFEIHQLWQSGFSRVYSNSCCSCSFEAEIIKIGQSSYKMYSNNILIFQESTTILNACTKKVEKLIERTTYALTSQGLLSNPGPSFDSMWQCILTVNGVRVLTVSLINKQWFTTAVLGKQTFSSCHLYNLISKWVADRLSLRFLSAVILC